MKKVFREELIGHEEEWLGPKNLPRRPFVAMRLQTLRSAADAVRLPARAARMRSMW